MADRILSSPDRRRPAAALAAWCVAVLVGLGLPACSPPSDSAEGPPEVSATDPGIEDDADGISGTYVVEGVTTALADERISRPIKGMVILVQDGDRYTSTFHLETVFPGPEGNLDAEVIGTGEGSVEGERLEGTASTQILTAAFPGVDTQFPFLSRRYGPRVVSETVAVRKPDGRIELQIETRAEEGESYVSTRTTMVGERSRARGVPGFPEVGAARQARTREAE